MKIGKYPVKHSYKLARIISDVMSLGIAAVIVISTVGFFPRYKAELSRIGRVDVDLKNLLIGYGYSLSWRHYLAWIFPALAAAIFGVYLILVLKDHRLEKYIITKQNAQSVYDWYAFAVSLCKIPLLMIVFQYMYICQQRLMFKSESLFSVSTVLYVMMIVIIIRLSVHRIRRITETEKPAKAADSGGVKAKIADDNDEKVN